MEEKVLMIEFELIYVYILSRELLDQSHTSLR